MQGQAVNRCILIFPDFPNVGVIDAIRERYDPAVRLVPPHITLVFPFVSDIPGDTLLAHMRSVLAGAEPFPLSLQGISAQKSFGNYLLLNVHTGKNAIKDLHKRLYSGMLEQYKPLWCRAFEPHLTVGRIDDDKAFSQAVEAVAGVQDEFCTCVRQIAVEQIAEDGHSIIEAVIVLSLI